MDAVRVWEEDVMIPTYEAGKPDKNPMFLEKRVYQGSSGKVYPYPTTEKISLEKRDRKWHAVYLENEYLKIMILPELGGRIQRAYDKTNNYDFVYYNHVIKPALVGLTGPWISGGIEFNWPQHHRPTTYMPVDFLIQEREDGSKSVLCHDVDQMYGSSEIHTFTLYPGKAYLEIRGQLYNRTNIPQTFLWWANPAVAVNDDTQSVFPPDVHFVMDHGKRDVSRFPIARGVYYKHDYSEGVDISRYKNIPVPTSYMAEHSDYNFVGGYDYGKEAGMLHVADHHFSPGKKQWTWGCGDFGKAWDRNLTDEDGPYIELMTGVYTENQPDFSWLKPFEEKVFKQYFMPYKKIGYVKNASINAAIRTELTEKGFHIEVYATGIYENAQIIVEACGKEAARFAVRLSPVEIFDEYVDCKELLMAVTESEADKTLSDSADAEIDVTKIKVTVRNAEGRELISYQEKKQEIPEQVLPGEAAKKPEEIRTNEELLLTATHIEQHRHATFLPDPYYLEGLKRDPGDSRINNAYGMLLLRRGLFAEAEKYFRAAVKRLTWRSPNPYNSEPYYNLGLALYYQNKYDDAFDAFYKATWTDAEQEMSYYYLAAIASARGDYAEALELAEKGIVKNYHNVKARGLKAALLKKLGRVEEAAGWIKENLRIDPFDYVSGYVSYSITKDPEELKILQSRMSKKAEHYLMTARDFAEAGLYEEAAEILKLSVAATPMTHYYLGYYLDLCDKNLGKAAADTGLAGETVLREYMKAEETSPYCCFPNKLEDIAVLKAAIKANPKGAKAYYYLGNLYYDRLQFDRAIELWEKSVELDDTYPTAHRNLALAYYNKRGEKERARKELEKAFLLDQNDARVFLELDQLYKKLAVPFEERIRNYETHSELPEERDDLMLEYVTLYNLAGQYEKAYETIMGHHFRPWEGAEGRISGQYKVSLLEMAKQKIRDGEFETAEELLNKALEYPENLGEGRLEGTKDNHIHYYLGLVKEKLGRKEEADGEFCLATLGQDEPAGMLYYYDQPADMILYKGLAHEHLGEHKAAHACFNKLMDYGEKHLRDHVENDYFAVSLPDFMIFEEDMDQKNAAHCHYLMGLANLGMGDKKKAAEEFEDTLKLDYNHQNAGIYRQMV